MKGKIFASLLIALAGVCVANAAELSCGAGYVLYEGRSNQTLDGIKMAECQRLWCVDLETGTEMGSDNKANSGYIMSVGTVKLCDNDGSCVECWGERRWCAGEAHGEWNPKYGAYTRNGDDNATYESYKKGSCFAWHLEKPQCEAGLIAVLQDNQWVCVSADGATGVSRESAVRRTGSMRRINM